MTLDVPSGTLKLNREFDVPVGGATKILLFIDRMRSFASLTFLEEYSRFWTRDSRNDE